MTIEISKEEYNSLNRAKAENETLKNEVTRLTEESKNKSIALEEERKKAKTKAEENKTIFAEKEAEIENFKKLLDLKDGEILEEKVKILFENNSKYSEILKSQEEQRNLNIEEYKKFLGEEFLKEKVALLDGLNPEKTEILLKEFALSKGFGKEDEKPKVGVHTSGDVTPNNTSDFDKLLNSGASSSELLSVKW